MLRKRHPPVGGRPGTAGEMLDGLESRVTRDPVPYARAEIGAPGEPDAEGPVPGPGDRRSPR